MADYEIRFSFNSDGEGPRKDPPVYIKDGFIWVGYTGMPVERITYILQHLPEELLRHVRPVEARESARKVHGRAWSPERLN